MVGVTVITLPTATSYSFLYFLHGRSRLGVSYWAHRTASCCSGITTFGRWGAIWGDGIAAFGGLEAKFGGLGAILCTGIALFGRWNVILGNGAATLGCRDTTFGGRVGVPY